MPIERSKLFADPPQKPLDFIEDFSALSVADLPDGIVNGKFEAPVQALLDKLEQFIPQATAIAANSYEDLDNQVVKMLKSRFRNFLNVGPFNLITAPFTDDSLGCLDWLNKQEPESVVYISFGTVITPPPFELQALSEALEESNLPYLWSFRGNPQEQLPEGFLERTIQKELAFKAVEPNVKFATLHCDIAKTGMGIKCVFCNALFIVICDGVLYFD
ncbi:UDP-glucuronosyl/UDP-glucosyltransferase [Corchorus olitorius]|uniref:UDP-glucuronosyl/UDP-glucosyltransferase n=1 Tax=Corchorus olitorius TaxID=93759 RepID=A0A1R3GA78_9ROSI|nr:UDP-glucuronosyl/UDP-glucosyltransferase [Corchorus olitorius]